MIKKRRIWKIIIIMCVIILNTSCAKNSLEKNLIEYHYSFNSSPDSIRTINIIDKKSIDSNFSAVFYEINKSGKLYYGFTTKDDEIIKIFRINEKKSNTDFFNQGCFMGKKKKSNINGTELPCYTVFVGEVPFADFSKIQLNWNCSTSELESQSLIDNRYFLFIKNGKDNNICNIILNNSKEKKTRIAYNQKNGEWVILGKKNNITGI